jgi:hypothetical protein
VDDFSEFIQNNESLDLLVLYSEGPVLIAQSAILSRVINNVRLERFDITSCHFENIGSFEQILEGCTGVKRLWVSCDRNSQCTAVASLLLDPASLLRDLTVFLYCENDSDNSDDEHWKPLCEHAVREISGSLVGNMHLTGLLIRCYKMRDSFDIDSIVKLLCDISSIKSVSN